MHIDSYQFGRIIIDGTGYDRDVIVFGDCVMSDWWRQQGHVLSVEDIESIFAAEPAVLVVGCGASGRMDVPQQVWQACKEKDVELEVYDTYKAVSRFNALAAAGKNVSAAFHITC